MLVSPMLAIISWSLDEFDLCNTVKNIDATISITAKTALTYTFVFFCNYLSVTLDQ